MARHKLYSLKSRLRIIERDHGRCIYCGRAGLGMHVDHVVPYAAGGNVTASNLATSCEQCNKAKHSRRLPKLVESVVLAYIEQRNQAFNVPPSLVY